MKIRLLQNCIFDEHFSLVKKGFEPLDFRHNPAPELREFQIFRELYAKDTHRKSDILGAVSTRFQGKSLLDGEQVHRWIEDNPGYDVYVVNPFPQFAYTHKNLWQFSENTRHPAFTSNAQKVFDLAGLDFDLSRVGHHSNAILSACSYWFGNAEFWTRYMEGVILPVLNLTAGQLGQSLYDFLYKHQEYYGSARRGLGSLPFVLERTVSLFLEKERNIRAIFYPADRDRVYSCCLFPFERDLVQLFGDRVDQWDRDGVFDEEQELYFARSSQMCGAGWRLHFQYFPVDFEDGDPRPQLPWFADQLFPYGSGVRYSGGEASA